MMNQSVFKNVKILNLNTSSQSDISYEKFTFSGGEPHIKITESLDNVGTIIIKTNLTSALKVIELLVAVSAIRHSDFGIKFNSKLVLDVGYFPGGRQDRIMQRGEGLTVKVYTDTINNLKFDEVYIRDPHSDVQPALLHNCHVIDNMDFITAAIDSVIDKKEEFNLISPDAGSNKKLKDISKSLSELGYTFNLVKCDKTRNTATGAITGFEVYSEDLKGLPSIIIDDICDGGGTFLGLGSELKKKNAGNLYLAITYGIFSKGFNNLEKMFNQIITTNLFKTEYTYKGSDNREQGIPVKQLKVIEL